MDDSTSDYQLNQSEVDFEFEFNEVPEQIFGVDEQFVSKVGMTFNILEDAAKFYKNYVKAAVVLAEFALPNTLLLILFFLQFSVDSASSFSSSDPQDSDSPLLEMTSPPPGTVR
ncbi:hypothetical protein Ahy_A06g027738 isoform D [Arachis hypogaea]|uniref:Uncharacterized protein n=1 Tax=Arachis hypogaea TaxID=3818 RepID=A0A445CPL8_ARAHY|nr:hypothetical protein Ahy_A06g027738 isoform D [Arachis hypogaea]